MQEEVNALQSEYNRIIRTTSFNNNSLLTGLGTNTVLQGGFGEKGSLEIQVGERSLGIESDPTRAGLLTRVDTASDGTPGNGPSNLFDISADGRFVVFRSSASNLVAGDTNGVNDVFVKDVLTRETIRVSTDSDGNQGNGNSYARAISADGRFIAFDSEATNLVDGDTNGVLDAFIKDIKTGETIRVSTDSNGYQANGASTATGISADGRFVAFESNATNLVAGDTNGVIDVFVKDLLTGETIRVSTDSDGNQGNAGSTFGAISADGGFVAFQSSATNVVAGDTNGVQDAFVKDLKTGETIRVSTDSNGSEGNGNTLITAISSDGRFVAFSSESSNLVVGDTNGVQDAFIKDMKTGETLRVSTNSDGNQANGASFATGISADGRFVAFRSTGTNLVEGDSNGVSDAFIKDIKTGETIRTSMNNDGSELNTHSIASGISADGSKALFRDFFAGISYIRDLSKTGINEISGMVVSNQVSARITLDLAKKYEEELSLYQAGIGAGLSRASTFISSLQTASENFQAASSQITDVDVADESSRLVRNQILQQSAAGVLAQANLQPQLVLSLLEDI